MEIDLSQFHQVFFEESFEGLDVMEQELLNLEEDSDRENINTIFRGAHSIKGGSATFNFKEVAEFTHVMETLLDEMREGLRPVSKNIVDLLLRSVDCLRGMLNKIQDGDCVGAEHISLVNRFNDLLNEDTTVVVDESESNQAVINSNEQSDGGGRWQIEFAPERYILETGNEPLRMFRELKGLGHLEVKANTEKIPDFNELKPESCYLSWNLKLDAEVEEEIENLEDGILPTEEDDGFEEDDDGF